MREVQSRLRRAERREAVSHGRHGGGAPKAGACCLSSIAAASVLAKVVRDRIMTRLDRVWPAYGFAQHKGYGSAEHMAAILEHGPCPAHRFSFAPVREMELPLF